MVVVFHLRCQDASHLKGLHILELFMGKVSINLNMLCLTMIWIKRNLNGTGVIEIEGNGSRSCVAEFLRETNKPYDLDTPSCFLQYRDTPSCFLQYHEMIVS